MKPLSVGSKQGVREFLTEIKTLSNVKHSNLVELVGFCIQGPNRTLVYEYVENGNLHTALLGKFFNSTACYELSYDSYLYHIMSHIKLNP